MVIDVLDLNMKQEHMVGVNFLLYFSRLESRYANIYFILVV